MTWQALLLALGVALALRLGFLALYFNRLESLWIDYERRGLSYRLARGIDFLTILAFGACAIYTLWTLQRAGYGGSSRYGTVFIVWFGISLLEKLAVHRFPRTNSPQLFLDAKMSLITNLALAVLAGLTLTGVTAVYFWVRSSRLER